MLNEMVIRAYAALLCLGKDEEGASAVEYGLILGLIAVVIIVTLGLIGTNLNDLFSGANTKLDAATP